MKETFQLEVVGWTFWGDPQYPRVPWIDEAHDRPYEQAVIAELRNRNYHFTGSYHQHGRFGVPVLNDGKQYSVSMRHWGRLMAEAWELEGKHAYLSWSWFPPKAEEETIPNPTDWNAEEDETAKQEIRFKTHEDEWITEQFADAETIALVLREHENRRGAEDTDDSDDR